MADIIELSSVTGDLKIDFDNRHISIIRDSETSKFGMVKYYPTISFNFSNVTSIELTPASFIHPFACSFIIDGYRLLTKDSLDVCQVSVPKNQEMALTSAIERLANECNLSPKKKKDKSVPEVHYESFIEEHNSSVVANKQESSMWDNFGKKDEGKEHRMRCNVCGNVFCYTDKDVSDNINKGIVGSLASISTIANAVGGTMYGAFESDKLADRNKMRDFSKCPNCNSSDLTDITEGDVNQRSNENQTSQNTSGVADEIKRFKELLDMGAITQEEFDAKKKQLLSL